MLWIGLHLPRLSMESFEATLSVPQSHGQPVALLAAHHIASVNDSAHALGVQPGLTRSTALALAPRLLLGQADAQRDAQALLGVAHGALAFTPAVSLSSPQGVLMEVQASLRYFGGRDALLARLGEALRPLGHHIACASAPTAQGAVWLSRLGGDLHCADLSALHQALARVPVGLLGIDGEHVLALESMGLRTIGALRRLPRAGLARRFGEALLDELDCAWGSRPDPRDSLVLPPVFDSGLELFARADTTEQLLHGAQVLLARLVAWLSAQHAFVRRFTLLMKHETRWRREGQVADVTRLDIILAEPSRDVAHLQSLLRERLALMQLPAPTLELGLQARDIAHQPPPNAELFPTPRSEQEGLTRLIERLQARLGCNQVQRWDRACDHRPEKSFRCEGTRPGASEVLDKPRGDRGAAIESLSLAPWHLPLGPPSVRPVWLLPQAQALSGGGAQPLLDGRPLQLLCGPERIEAGWWDVGLAERDYFVARTLDGALVWLYRARLPASAGEEKGAGWFLQGRFG